MLKVSGLEIDGSPVATHVEGVASRPADPLFFCPTARSPTSIGATRGSGLGRSILLIVTRMIVTEDRLDANSSFQLSVTQYRAANSPSFVHRQNFGTDDMP
jgi:hypothetical protein